jgi:hypothetical protein
MQWQAQDMNGCSKNACDNAAAAKLGIMCKQPRYDSLAAKELSHNPEFEAMARRHDSFGCV